MKPSRPYLLRALYEWVLDNNMTPHIAVDATLQGVQVPDQFVQDGQITLNIAPSAVQGLMIDDQGISFSARFGGVPMNVYVPMVAVLAIFTRENGMGMGFGMEPGVEVLLEQAENAAVLQEASVETSVAEDDTPRRDNKKPTLRVVK
ncbi:ClpXP protease specificity-enhancing factor [Marinobacterium sediminicola]|uniref:ClpXP protease specificity-enhancing factor n=1 Tax=Marinobacterium sediminicola TaxID=518898 RepID=UPI001EF07E13|nr:ClpXP protease specificity-enhancing factor [Marinobacterium sediminicola]ULG70795.1 ClpXP protease specificity-enhancing factor [Marinobacterium sediminicola]